MDTGDKIQIIYKGGKKKTGTFYEGYREYFYFINDKTIRMEKAFNKDVKETKKLPTL
jgi:hypothetical protein